MTAASQIVQRICIIKHVYQAEASSGWPTKPAASQARAQFPLACNSSCSLTFLFIGCGTLSSPLLKRMLAEEEGHWGDHWLLIHVTFLPSLVVFVLLLLFPPSSCPVNITAAVES